MRDMLAIWEISKRTVKAWHTLILRPRRYNYVVASVSLGASYAFLTGNEVSDGLVLEWTGAGLWFMLYVPSNLRWVASIADRRGTGNRRSWYKRRRRLALNWQLWWSGGVWNYR